MSNATQDLAVLLARVETKLDLMHDDVKDIKPRLRDVEEDTAKLKDQYETHKKITVGVLITGVCASLKAFWDYLPPSPP